VSYVVPAGVGVQASTAIAAAVTAAAAAAAAAPRALYLSWLARRLTARTSSGHKRCSSAHPFGAQRLSTHQAGAGSAARNAAAVRVTHVQPDCIMSCACYPPHM
jgi:hypothetical protein